MKLKDKKIEILAALNYSNGNGYFSETLTPIGPPVWAYFRHLSCKEILAASAQMAVDIARVDTFEGPREDLTLFCKKRR